MAADAVGGFAAVGRKCALRARMAVATGAISADFGTVQNAHTRFPTSSESQLILETMSGLATLKTLSNHMIHAPFNTQKEQGTCHVPHWWNY